MENIKLTLSLLKKVIEELKNKICGNHFAHISVINSTDVLFQFSFYVKEKLLISLNHHNPIISLIGKDFTSPTVMGGLSDNLRKNLKGTFITDISILNEDRVIKFSLQKTNDFYEKEEMSLVVELIPTKSNLLILDKEDKILYAYHYTDITHNHPIVRGMKYVPLDRNSNFKEQDSPSIDEYKKYAQLYLLEATSKRKKESQKPLYTFLVTKRKSLYKKIDVLNNEKKDAESKLVYKEYGEMIYAYLYDKEELEKYVKENLEDLYYTNLTPEKNAGKIFDKYKRAKRTIEHDDIEIKKAYDEIDEISNYINTFDYLDDNEMIELHNKYMLHHGQKAKKSKVDPRFPFYVKEGNTIIAFGKNAIQNDYLTFKKADRDHLFLHIDHYSGSHVVIFNTKPTNAEMLTASEICLILSNQKAGDIKYAPVRDIKKGQSSGQVNMLSYKLITLREIRSSTYELLLSLKRFTN